MVGHSSSTLKLVSVGSLRMETVAVGTTSAEQGRGLKDPRHADRTARSHRSPLLALAFHVLQNGLAH